MQPLIMALMMLSSIPEEPLPVPVQLTDEQIIERELKDYPALKEICWCESGLRQVNDKGELIIGIVNNEDRGICQINRVHHKKKLEEMNLDPDKLEDNLKFAKYLYDQNGTKDWQASRSCWEKKI